MEATGKKDWPMQSADTNLPIPSIPIILTNAIVSGVLKQFSKVEFLHFSAGLAPLGTMKKPAGWPLFADGNLDRHKDPLCPTAALNEEA